MIEIIATNLEDCQIINSAKNIGRIELCQNLLVGGVTPNYAVIEECCAFSKIPIRVIVRHHYQDYYCPPEEYFQIKKDIEFIKTTKAEGIVVGILTKNDEIDITRMQEIISLSGRLKITFHRAFDQIKNKNKAINILAKLKINTLLTQGGLESIEKNLSVLQGLCNYGVEIQAGSGINFSNFKTVAKYVDAIHIGSAVRQNNDWNKKIDLNKLLQLEL